MENVDIVFVEDNAIDAQFFERAIRKADPLCRFRRFADGQAAVDFVTSIGMGRAEPPRLLVLDIKLPKLLGFEVLAAVRSHRHTRFLPVVMLSSSTQQADIDRAYALGANAYLNKPPTMVELNQVVSHLVAFWLKINRRTLLEAVQQ